MNRIIRVFVRKTSYTPTDELAFVGMPPMRELIPDHDEVHVSCVFTWDMDEAENLAFQWEAVTDKPVKLGGQRIKVRARTSLRVCMSEKASFSQAVGATIIVRGAASGKWRERCASYRSRRGMSSRTTTFCNVLDRTRKRCLRCCARSAGYALGVDSKPTS